LALVFYTLPFAQLVQLYPCFQMAEDGWT
jgi:hypothetical protein